MHGEFASTSTYSPSTSLPGKGSSEHISCLSHTFTAITAEIQKCKDRDSYPAWGTCQLLLSTENTEAWDLTYWDIQELYEEVSNYIAKLKGLFFKISRSQRDGYFLSLAIRKWDTMSFYCFLLLVECRPKCFLRSYGTAMTSTYPRPYHVSSFDP